MSLPALATALILSPVAQAAPPAPPAPTSPPAARSGPIPRELADPLIDPATMPVTASVNPKPRHAPGDPLEGINRFFFKRQQTFDRHFLRPTALGYKHVVPKPVRSGLRHFFQNLGEPLVFLNFLLQFKPGKAAETAGRFLLNTTFGVGGVLDVAVEPGIGLPHRPNGFGDTLGYYGVKPGPYLFLPLLGPTTLRDLIGGQAEAVIIPLTVGTPFDRAEFQVTRAVVTGLDARAEADQEYKALLRDAVDPYATFRSAFLQDRAGEIAHLHGADALAKPAAELNDPLADPAAATSTDSREPQASNPNPAVNPPTPHDKADEGKAGSETSASPKPEAETPELSDPLGDPAAAPLPR